MQGHYRRKLLIHWPKAFRASQLPEDLGEETCRVKSLQGQDALGLA
jgi:hypothetical protein